MAEGLMKKLYGQRVYVQSAGVRNDLEIDGFAIAVCKEIGVELSRHRSRSFDEMQQWGDDLSGFDLVVALSPASQRQALELTRYFHHRPGRDPRNQAVGLSPDPRSVACADA
jgi:arsenate reductase